MNRPDEINSPHSNVDLSLRAGRLMESSQDGRFEALISQGKYDISAASKMLDHRDPSAREIWELAANREWESLRALKQIQEIDLNAAPLADTALKGISVAWLLADRQQWELLTELSGSQEVDLNAAPLADTPIKGISVAWQLVCYSQYELLMELKGAREIDLNAAPRLNTHPNQGVSIAWWLAFGKEWELLRELRGNQEVDLNAAPLSAEGGFYLGISLAHMLARKHQWQLLRELKGTQEVDLNAGNLIGGDKDVTLAWLLVYNKQWQLLRELKGNQEVDLNAAALEWDDDEDNENEGITVAWLLAHHQQWRLLRELRGSQRIDLTAAPLAANSPYGNKSLALILSERQSKHLVASYSGSDCDAAEGIEQEAERLFTRLSSVENASIINREKALRASYFLAVAQKSLPQLSALLEDAHAWCQDKEQMLNLTQGLLSSSFIQLDRIDPENPCYSRANTIKGHIMLKCLARPELYMWLRDNREQDFIEHKPMNWHQLSVEAQLRLCMDYYLSFDPEDRVLRYQYLAEFLVQKESINTPHGQKRALDETNAKPEALTDKGKEKATEDDLCEEESSEKTITKKKRLSSEEAQTLQSWKQFKGESSSGSTSGSLFLQSAEDEQVSPEGSASLPMRFGQN